MFILNSMTRKVVTIEKTTRVLEARELMKKHDVRHLPVVEEGRLVGIVTDRDIRSALPSILFDDYESAKKRERLEGLKAQEIMTENPVTVSPQYTIQDALLLIHRSKVGAFPVVDEDGMLKGIISVRDLIESFINVMGIGEPGTLLCILMEQKVGQLKKLVDAATEENISIGSILVARYWDKNKRAVFPYLLTNNVMGIKKKLREMGFELLDPMQWYLDRLPKSE